MVIFKRSFVLTAIAGGLLPLGYPPWNLPLISMFAFSILLFELCRSETAMRSTLLGLVTGVVFIGTGYAWVFSFMRWAGSLAIVFHALITLYHASYFAVFALVFHGLRKKWGYGAALLASPLLWTLLEYLATFGPFGIPETIGHGQFLNPIFRAGVPILGVNYLSFLTVALDALIVLSFIEARKRPAPVISCWVLLLSVLALNDVVNSAQKRERAQGDRGERRATLGLVQPDLDIELLNDPTKGKEVLSAYLNETQGFFHGGSPVDVLLWPEMVFPYITNQEGSTRNELFKAFEGRPEELLIGGPAIASSERFRNDVFLLSNGAFRDTYEKERLFPIGEYIPFRMVLGFVKKYLPLKLREAEYEPGDKNEPLLTKAGKAGVSICLESLYTDLIRRRVAAGAEFLVNFTNDAWFEGSVAEQRHFFIGAMRALENGRYFVQTASAGFAGIVSPDGDILLKIRSGKKGSIAATIEKIKAKTLFTKLGLWRFGVYGILTLAAALVYVFTTSRGTIPMS